MVNYVTEPRGYWKVTKKDLEEAQSSNYSGINFEIKGDGERWEDGTGTIVINKESDEWRYLTEYIAKLECFRTKREHTSSNKIPAKLKSCYVRNG